MRSYRAEPIVSLDSMKSELAEDGFLLCDTEAIVSLPSSVWLEPSSIPQRYQSGCLLLVAHAGKQFWQAFSQGQTAEYRKKPDPIDAYSAEVTERVLEKYLPNVARLRLFPSSDCPVNLMALGRAFGWHSPSPLGMGIHEKYGLWSAYRAAWWLDIERLEVTLASHDLDKLSARPNSPAEMSDVCLQCQTQECVTACPSNAVTHRKNPELGHCADYRLTQNSQCESTCLSRMACPYASEHRYTGPQMSYHYDLARSAIAKYRQHS